jgi:hypothetical protein
MKASEINVKLDELTRGNRSADTNVFVNGPDGETYKITDITYDEASDRIVIDIFDEE